MIAITLGVPVVQLLLLGWAISTDVEHVPTVIADLDNSSLSRGLVSKFENSRYLDVQFRTNDVREVSDLLQHGDVILAITIQHDFQRDLVRRERPRILLSADAQNTNVALTGAGYVRRIILSWAEQYQAKMPGFRPSGLIRLNTISTESRIWYNPELKSVYFMVPGIMVVLVTVITIMLTAISIVKEREMGTLEQLMVSPITRAELILGKTIPFAMLGLMELVISLIVAKAVYHIPISGSITEFFLMTIVFIFSALGLGIFVSTLATTQQQALFTAWFIMVFCLLMSGFFLPIENMPKVWQTMTYINPLRYYMTIVRGLFLKGAGFEVLWKQILALAVIATVVLTGSVVRFRKKLE